MTKLAAAAAALLLAGCGAVSPIIKKDDFSEQKGGWQTTDRDSHVLEFDDGGYRIRVKDLDTAAVSGVALYQDEEANEFREFERMSVEVDAKGRGEGESLELYGVACFDTRTIVGYVFGIDGRGGFRIVRMDDERDVTLEDGESAAIRSFEETNTLRGECLLEEDGSATLVAYVNERKVAEARDDDPPVSFQAVAFYVKSPAGPADVLFDDFLAERA